MKEFTTTLRQLALDGATLVAAVSLTLGGLWGLSMIGASLFTLSVFSVLMLPAIISATVYFSRDLKDATDTLIA